MNRHYILIKDALTTRIRQMIDSIDDDHAKIDLDQCLEKALTDTLELAIFLQEMITIRQEAKQKADDYTLYNKK
jgi:hypothetical protein